MSMNLVSSFSLDIPSASSYALLLDLDRVAPCLPGATLAPAVVEHGPRDLEMTVKLGPMTFRYRGELEIVERDVSILRAVLRGSAREVRGQGTANADLVMSVRDDGEGGSHVDIDATVDLTGRAAQLGGGMVEAVADRLVEDMARCLRLRLAESSSASGGIGVPAGPADAERVSVTQPTPEPQAVRVGAVLLRALCERFARPFRRRH